MMYDCVRLLFTWFCTILQIYTFTLSYAACAADGAHRVHRAIGRPIDAWLPSCSNEKTKDRPFRCTTTSKRTLANSNGLYFLDGLSSASLFASACNLASSSAGNRPKEEVPVA